MQLIPSTPLRYLSLAMASLLFVGCGGGGGGGDSSTPISKTTPATTTVDKTEETINEILPEPQEVVENNQPVSSEGDNEDKVTNVPTATNGDFLTVEKKVFERLNSRRTACGFGALKVSKSLTDAATNHANYLLHATQYSSAPFSGHAEARHLANPYFSGEGLGDRINTKATTIGAKATPVSYQYGFLDESLSYLQYNDAYRQQYGDETIALNSINGLLSAPYHLASLVRPSFNQVGISYGSAPTQTAKLQGSVLEIVLGRPLSQSFELTDKVLSYPCDGLQDIAYELTNETPNPFGNTRDLSKNPIGQPIYILGNGKIQVSNAKLTDSANKPIELQVLNAVNDPNKRLKAHQVFLLPLSPLMPNQWYRVSYDISVDGGNIETKTFRFKTKSALK